MLVALTIKKEKNKNWISRIISLILPNKINFEKKVAGSVMLLHITINKKNNRIPWKKLSKILKTHTQSILCREDVELPDKYGFSRYNAVNLKKELCKNAAVSILKVSDISPEKLKISLFDPAGKHSEILKQLIFFSNQVNVITYNTKKYLRDQEKIMQEFGASIVVSDNLDWLFKSHIVLAPDKITTILPTCQSCLIFTAERSSVPLKGIVYHDYKVSVPYVFKNIIPSDLDPEYFLSAIYDKYRIINLKHMVPPTCFSENKESDIKNIARELFNRCQFTYAQRSDDRINITNF